MSHQPSPAMNHDPAQVNGQPPTPRSHQNFNEPIAYFGALHSPPVYRSIYSVRAQLDQTGTFAAKRRIVTALHQRLNDEAISRIPIEDLRPDVAATAAAERFIATSPLAVPVDRIEGLSDRIHEVEQLRRNRPSPNLSMLNEIVCDAAAKQFADLEPRLAEAVALAPLAARKWLAVARQHVEELDYPEPSEPGFLRLAKIIGHLRSLNQDSTALPPHKRTAIEPRLVHAGHAATLAALREIAAERTVAAYRSHVVALRAKLQEWQAQTEACDRHITALAERLDEEKTRFQHRQARQTRAGLIVLDGPSEARVLEAMAEELACSPDELAAVVLKAWIARLAQKAANELGDETAGRPGELLARTDPAESLSVLHALVNERLPRVSIYAAVRAVGVDKFVNQLYAKAAPLVQLDRRSVELGLEFIDAAVFVAPPAQGPEDGKTVAELKNAFARHGSVHLRIADNKRAEIRLTRTLAGFPAAVQSINGALMWGYAKSREQHHFPHLTNIVPDSPDGRASEAAVEFMAALKRRNGESHG